jgi:hypothetical protein
LSRARHQYAARKAGAHSRTCIRCGVRRRFRNGRYEWSIMDDKGRFNRWDRRNPPCVDLRPAPKPVTLESRLAALETQIADLQEDICDLKHRVRNIEP